MALDTTQINRILGAVRARDTNKVEELWIDLQSSDPELEDLKTFLRVANEVASRGDKDKAAELLLLLKDDLKAKGRSEELFRLLHKAIKLSPRVKGIREDLVEQYREKYNDRPGLEAVISRTDMAGEGNLAEAIRQLDEAFHFAVGEYVFHGRGWGIGKVVEASPGTGEFVIDFARRRGQRMEAGMALKALDKCEPDDLEVLLWTDKDAIRDLAKSDPLELLRKALRGNNGKIQSRDLKSKLSEVLEKSAWTRFWNKARKLAKDDPQIELGSAPRSVISLRDKPLSRDEEVAHNVKQSVDFKGRIILARRELISHRGTSEEEAPGWMKPVLAILDKGRRKSGSTKAMLQASRIEVAFFKEETAEIFPAAMPDVNIPDASDAGVDPDTGEPLPAPVTPHVMVAFDGFTDASVFPALLAGMASPEYRKKAVGLIPRLDPAGAPDTLEAVLLEPAAQTFGETCRVLKSLGRDDVILRAVTKILIKPMDHPAALCAFARARLAGRLDVLPERTDGEIVAKTIQVLDDVSLRHKASNERKEKAALKVIVDGLRTFLGDKNQKVLATVVENGTEDEIRRILQLVRQSPTLTQTLKRATEKFVVLRFPDLLATVATTARPEDEGPPPLYSTAEGKKRRERELSEIMEVKMPEITVEIGKALEFGDISENAELDAAREKQQRLAEQATRMTDELERVRIIDPSTVETDEVRVGTRVVSVNQESGEEETYSLLGPWDIDDADPTIISHMSALAQGLMGSKVGDTRTVKLPGGNTATYEVKSIERAILQDA